VQKVMVSLEVTDRVMDRTIYHPDVLQPLRVSLACGLQRNTTQLPLPLCIPWLVPAPHSLCQWANGAIWQLHT